MPFPKGGSVPPSKRPPRTRPAVRLESYLLAFAGRKKSWTKVPSYRELAERLGYSITTINTAFRAMEADPWCPLEFVSDYDGPGKTRRKMMARKKDLKFDRLPLFRREDGTARGTRRNFRRRAEPLKQVTSQPKQVTPKPKQVTPSPRHPKQNPDKRQGGNCTFPSRVIKEDYVSGQSPFPRPPAGLSETRGNDACPAGHVSANTEIYTRHATPNALAWRHAREALADGAMFYDNRKPVMPVASLRALLLPAFERGMSWERTIRPALRHALQEAHNAAVLGEVRNPGGMAAVIFRERVGLAPKRRRRGFPDFKPGDYNPASGRREEPCNSAGNVSEPWKIKIVPVAPRNMGIPASVDKSAVRAQFAGLAAAMRAGVLPPRYSLSGNTL